MSSETSAVTMDASSAYTANREVLAGTVAACADQFAELIAGLFAESGMSRDAGAQALERAAARLRAGAAALPATTEYPWVQLGDALALWWRDEAYLDDQGRPRALPTHGPAPSLDELFSRTIDPRLWPAARQLLARTAAREHDGMWTVVQDSSVLHLDGHESAQRILFYLTGGLNSWVDNLVRQHEHKRSKNVDRGSVCAAFPQALLPELRSKLHKRMTTIMGEIDAWLTYQSQNHKEGPVVLVGLDFMMHASPPRPRPAAVHADETARVATL